MKYLVLLLALIGSAAHAAEMQWSNGMLTVVLGDSPCTSEIVLAMLKPAAREMYRNGSVTFGGVETPLCWRVSPDGQNVWVVDEDGEAAKFPIKLFAPAKPI